MKTEWREGALYILSLPLDAMGRLAACAPGTPAETEVLAALLAGAKVYLCPGALAYKHYRSAAGDGIYTRCTALERKLREMGIRRAPQSRPPLR